MLVGVSLSIRQFPRSKGDLRFIPSPLLLSVLAALLLAASALAAAACSLILSLISRSRLFLAAALRKFCLALAPARVGISSTVFGDRLR